MSAKLNFNFKNKIGAAATIAIIDPIFGMKFRKNVSVAKKVRPQR